MAKLKITDENLITSFNSSAKKESFKNSKEEGFKSVEISLVNPDPNQPRKIFDQNSLKELAESIKSHGLIQPVLLRQDEKGVIYLVDGERRYRAAKAAGLKYIDGIFNTSWIPEEISLIGNLQREDLSPIEEALAYDNMINKYNYTQEALSKVVKKDQTTISHTLSLNRLPGLIKEEYAHAHISKGMLIEIAKLKTDDEMLEAFERVINLGLTRADIRKENKKSKTPKVDKSQIEKLSKITKSCFKEYSKVNLEELSKKDKAIVKELYSEFIKPLSNKLGIYYIEATP